MFYIELFIYYLIAINLFVFLLFGIDKLCAIQKWWRIPEITLLTGAIIGASLGALAGMLLFHHKTSHLKFTIGIPVILLLQLVGIIYVYVTY